MEKSKGEQEILKTNLVLSDLEKRILIKIKKLRETFEFAANLNYAIGSIHFQMNLLEVGELFKKELISKAVFPFLKILKRPLLPFITRLCSKGLFLFNLVYKNERKHPNFKIINSVLKSLDFKSPSNDSVCTFFPTPKQDVLMFDKNTALPTCYLKSKSSTQVINQQLRLLMDTASVKRSNHILFIFYLLL